MNAEQVDFADAVMRRIGAIEDDEDRGKIRSHAMQLYAEGWTADDAVRLLRCFEEVSPDLDEETALRRMRAIRAKYDGRTQ